MSKHAIRALTKGAYRTVAKPIMFRQSPDRVHSGLLRTAKNVQRIPLVRKMPALWAYHNEDKLGQEYCKIRFSNPVGLSAGFDKDIEMAGVIRAVGFGYMIGGSVTAEKNAGNPRPWYYRLPKSHSLLVNAGLPSKGVDAVARRLLKYPSGQFTDFPLSVSIAKTNSKKTVQEAGGIADYVQSFKRLELIQTHALYELNISCPNAHGGEPFTTPKKLDNLLAALDDLHLSRPLFVKMPINLTMREFGALLRVIDKHRVEGLTIGNLSKDRKNAQLHDTLSAKTPGNLSGEPTRELTLKLIRYTRKKYDQRFVIIGVGGIFSAKDAYDKIRAGANLVALITGMIFEGPQLIGDINKGLVALLARDGLANISEAIGSDIKEV